MPSASVCSVTRRSLQAGAAFTVNSFLGNKDPKTNTIKIAEDTASISETFSSPDKQVTDQTDHTKSVAVKNTGSAECFVRVYLELSDSRLAGDKVQLSADGTNFKSWAEFKEASVSPADWVYIDNTGTALDGYFYYTKKLAPGAATSDLIKKVRTAYNDVYDIPDFEIIVYSETVQTVETDESGTQYTDSQWETAWKSFLKIT